MRCSEGGRWLLYFLGVIPWLAQAGGDTAYLAQPHSVYRVGTRRLPQGVELLSAYHRGETLFAWIRFWEAAPQGQQWIWGGDTMRTVVQIPPLPPDSTMPMADFRIPAQQTELVEAESPPALTFLLLGLMGMLLMLALYPLYRGILQREIHRMGLRLRWWVWLWRWRSPDPARFFDFCAALKALLSPYATVHPGSLTLSELAEVQTDPKLHEALRALWALEYRMSFTTENASPEEIQRVWSEVWQALRRIRPSSNPPLISLPPSRHTPDGYVVAR